jgi:hypothetical protein
MWKCEYQKDETWKCEKAKASANLPPGLSDALDDVTAAKAPNNGKVLSENEESQNNMTFSRANITAPN